MKKNSAALILILSLILGGCGDKLSPWLEGKGVTLDQQWLISPEDFDAHDLFLVGESHGVAENYSLMYDLTLWFHKQGVRYHLAEYGYSHGQMVNRYLETGDRGILDELFAHLEGTAAWSKETYQFYERIYQYNQGLPREQRIIMVGIDIEHQPRTAVNYLRRLAWEAGPAPSNLAGPGLLANPPEGDVRLLTTALLEDLEAKERQYRLWLGREFFSFQMTVRNIQNYIASNAEDRQDFDRIREEAIYSNFLAVASHLPPGKFFGQWGMEHVYQRLADTYMGQQPRFAMLARDDNDSPVWGKVLSMAIIYGPESRAMSWGREYGIGGVHQQFTHIKPFIQAAQGKITLFPLQGAGSPFAKDLYIVRRPLQGGVTTDYFQYAIVIPRGTPAEPLK
jgi:hypothetical protein